jgi:hypothetical protein
MFRHDDCGAGHPEVNCGIMLTFIGPAKTANRLKMKAQYNPLPKQGGSLQVVVAGMHRRSSALNHRSHAPSHSPDTTLRTLGP